MKATNLICFAFALANVEAIAAPSITPSPVALEKRLKDVVVNPDYRKQQEAKEKGEPVDKEEDKPEPWLRPLEKGGYTRVTPTVIAGVTFNGKPPKETNGLEPWVSLKKDGSPKTIVPKIKNGHTKDARPTYGTWFATPTTVTIPKHQVHGADEEDEEITDVQWIDEDSSFHQHDPLIRCTPDRYYKKGLAKDIESKPFCTPHDNQRMFMDKTYFISWYSKFYPENTEKVRVHLSFVKESLRQKGLKRDLFNESTDSQLNKRSSVMQKGGTLEETSFFVSDWVDNIQGFYPLTIDEKWFDSGDYYRKVMISLQPDSISDDVFNHQDQFVVVEIGQRPKVGKGHNEDLKKLEEKYKNQHLDPNAEVVDNLDYEKYFIMMSMPTAVAIVGLAMYLFVWFNKRSIDLAHLKKYKFKPRGKRFPFKKQNKYSSLPQYAGEAPKND